MGLNYEMALYTELTGEDGTKVPIGQLGHFLWGYEIGIAKCRPKGKWIEDTGLYATCSNCKENLYQAIEYKFCPNCGADMRGEE